jgi:hypothetical protein
VGIKKAGRSEDTENLNVPSEMMMVKGKGTNEVRERLPLGWTLSPAYPSRLGVAGSMLIPASSSTNAKLTMSCKGWVKRELSAQFGTRSKDPAAYPHNDERTMADLRRTPNPTERSYLMM